MPIPFFQVDSFTEAPFAGNPAGVCVLTKPIADDLMQQIAMEMNLSETAFVVPSSDPFKRSYDLRWFTPKTEIKLCGHGTLATAHVLWSLGHLRPTDPAKFDTLSGRLTCTYDTNRWITMDFPARTQQTADAPDGLLAALGVTDAVYIGRNEQDWMIELDSAETVRTLAPNQSALADINCRVIIVTAPSDQPEYDSVSRVFGPAMGIPEDPVTGSAHCILAPYWAEKLGKTTLNAYQASARGGMMQLELDGDRVKIKGKAVTVLQGELTV